MVQVFKPGKEALALSSNNRLSFGRPISHERTSSTAKKPRVYTAINGSMANNVHLYLRGENGAGRQAKETERGPERIRAIVDRFRHDLSIAEKVFISVVPRMIG
jgi:hypothetical protein